MEQESGKTSQRSWKGFNFRDNMSLCKIPKGFTKFPLTVCGRFTDTKMQRTSGCMSCPFLPPTSVSESRGGRWSASPIRPHLPAASETWPEHWYLSNRPLPLVVTCLTTKNRRFCLLVILLSPLSVWHRDTSLP